MTGEAAPGLEITGVAQHASWLQRLRPPVERLRCDLWSIPVPIPNNPLRYVSVYVLCGDDGLTLIDAGWDAEESWAALCAGLAGLGASIADIRACLVSHRHRDHIGLARRVREASGAWIGLHPTERDWIMHPDFREPDLAAAADIQWLTHLGASEEEALRLQGRHGGEDPRAGYPEPDRLIEDGQLLDLPGWTLRAVHTPGHTPGHLCFVEDRQRLLFAGDHVLPRISPNISADRRPHADALTDFLHSLDKVAALDVDEVLPAHEWRFRGLPQRVRQLRAHHEVRLGELLDVVREHPGGVPWDLAGRLTWSRPWDQYDGYMRISAVLETTAHLVYLRRHGLVVASAEPVPRYVAVDPLPQ